MTLRSWTVSQLSAREGYAAGRAFAAAGRLRRLYTEAWCRYGASLLRHGPAACRAFAGRFQADIPPERVTAFTGRVVGGKLWRAAGITARATSEFEEFLRVGAWFDDLVARRLRRQKLQPSVDAFFAFDTGCLECLRLVVAAGAVALVDQIDPARVEYDIVRDEAAKWPGWELVPLNPPDAYFDRLAAEWDAASGVVVNSRWAADALVRQGVAREKLHVVPLAYESRAVGASPRNPSGRPLVVLWLGNVILRKGIQYLIEAARQLTDRAIRFVVAGPVGITPHAVATAPANVEFRGRVTRDRATREYLAADVFVLPTLSDGFALTQLEAMAHGLPVIATSNCGAVVDHGRDGLIVPAGDARLLAEAVAALDDDRGRVAAMGEAALAKSRQFSLAAYAARLDAAAAAAAPMSCGSTPSGGDG
jgi:glycosyltransferase involved in cell wall biosynthesis